MKSTDVTKCSLVIAILSFGVLTGCSGLFTNSTPATELTEQNVDSSFEDSTLSSGLAPGKNFQISVENGILFNPDIYNDRIVWWNDRSNVNENIYELYVYDLSKQTKNLVRTSNEGIVRGPKIFRDRITWAEGFARDFDLNLHDLSTHAETFLTTSQTNIQSLAICGNHILWHASTNVSNDIFLYDIANLSIIPIAAGPFTVTGPNITERFVDISGNRVVWLAIVDGFGFQVFLYDLKNEKLNQLTDDAVDHVSPAIDGDRIVWLQEGDVFLYDIPTQKKTQLSESGTAEDPAIYGNHIVWADNRNGNSDIFLYDLCDNSEIQLTKDSANDTDPAIHNNRIVWASDGQIFFYEIAGGENHTPLTAGI